jgi:hypothetical protein
MKPASNAPGPEEKVCGNCAFLAWLVGIGQGARCTCEENKRDGKELQVPGRRHSCGHFRFRRESEE